MQRRTIQAGRVRRRRWIAAAATLALAAGAAYAAVGPTGPGQFYYYFDDSGQVVGYSAIRCDGTREAWGKATRTYSDGVFRCEPDD